MFVLKILTAIVLFIVALIAGAWPLIQKSKRASSHCSRHGDHGERSEFVHRDSPMAESITSGIFLGAALLHMLPQASAQFSVLHDQYPIAFLLMALSFLFFLWLEHWGAALSNDKKQLISGLVLITALMLSIHSLLEGLALGVTGNISTAGLIGLAILAHKGAASFALANTLNQSRLAAGSALAIFILFALMTPVGILVGAQVSDATSVEGTLLTAIFSSLAAGTFLYIGTLHGLERSHLITHCCNMREFFFMLLGFALMAIVALWV